jgi:hypothetical protein
MSRNNEMRTAKPDNYRAQEQYACGNCVMTICVIT